MFAVGHKQRLDDALTYQTYHDKMAALMDATFPGRPTLVQAGVDDVASHLAPVDPAAPSNALVVFPEDTGLLAAFIGTRGASARGSELSTDAILALFVPYGPQIAHYQDKFPNQPSPIRYLVLALTDTFYRAVYETFRELAMTHGVYLAVGTNMAPARRVEEADEPELVALLRDPDEPTRTYAYEAVSSFSPNATYVFAPDGEVLVADGSGGTLRSPSETGGVIRGSTTKAYLVPIEQPPPAGAGLALSTTPIRDQEVLDTPVGRLAIVISKDAWMVDVNDRFVAKGANVVLQPEAFDSWAFTTTEWSPDVFREGGFANVQKNPEWVVNVDASMTGNLLEITFDGQTTIIGRKHKSDPGPLSPNNAWIGQNPDTAFLAVAPWVIPDPGIADPGMTLAARRTALVADGVLLRPGTGLCPDPLQVGVCENGYRESIIWTDVDVPTTATTSAPDPNRELPPMFGSAARASGFESTPVAQHAPRIAARGRHVYVVWHQDEGAGSSIRLAVSHDAGISFEPPILVSDNLPGSVNELHPAIAVRGGRVYVVWQEFASLGNDDAGRIMMARFSARPLKIGFDVRVDDLDGVGKWMPSIAFVGSKPIVAWTDERDLGPEGEPLEHVYAARVFAGTTFGPSVRVDSGTPVDLSLHNDNKWAPSIAASKRQVLVAWADFRNYQWDIYSARSFDGGLSYQPNVRVDDSQVFERVNERPSVAMDRRGTVHVAWTDLRSRQPDTNIFYAHSADFGATFSENVQLDDSKVGFDPDTDTPSNQWHPSLAVDGEDVFAAWQDNRLGNNDVFFTQSINGGVTFTPAERVDDTGSGPSEQTRPSLALSGRGAKRICCVAWEDGRNGDRDVYVASRPCPDY